MVFEHNESEGGKDIEMSEDTKPSARLKKETPNGGSHSHVHSTQHQETGELLTSRFTKEELNSQPKYLTTSLRISTAANPTDNDSKERARRPRRAIEPWPHPPTTNLPIPDCECSDCLRAEISALRARLQKQEEATRCGYLLAMRLLQSDIILDGEERSAIEFFTP